MGDKCLESNIAMISLMSRQFTFQTKWVKEKRRSQLFAGLMVSPLRAYQTREVVVLSRGFFGLQQIQVLLKCSKNPHLEVGSGSWRPGSLKTKGGSYCFPNCSGRRKPFNAGVLLTSKKPQSFVNAKILLTKMSLHLVGYFSSHSSAGDMNSENTEILKPQKYFISHCVLWSTFKKKTTQQQNCKTPQHKTPTTEGKEGHGGQKDLIRSQKRSGKAAFPIHPHIRATFLLAVVGQEGEGTAVQREI